MSRSGSGRREVKRAKSLDARRSTLSGPSQQIREEYRNVLAFTQGPKAEGSDEQVETSAAPFSCRIALPTEVQPS